MPKRIIKEKSVFHTPWFALVARWTNPPGSRPYYAIRTTDYVSVIALTPAGKYILVRQYRPAVGCRTVEFPGGTVDAGMTPKETAVKELLEETGYRPGRLFAVGSLLPDAGRMMNRLWVFYAINCERVKGTASEEGISTFLASSNGMDQLIRSGKFNQALNIAALAIAHRKFKF
jgi:ADP-ribose pyrophosphatase